MRILIVLSVLLATLTPALADPAKRQITVSGQGSVEAVPDMATIVLGVTHQAAEAADAMAQVRTESAAIIRELTELGVADQDMQTRSLSLSPVWSNRRNSNDAPPKITGFVARNTLMIRVRDLETLGGLLDAVLGRGANYFSGLRFGLQNPDPLVDAARKDAVADARAKAELLAEAAGVRLGAVMSITDHGDSGPVMMEAAAVARSAPDIAAGELTLRASVGVVYLIAD